MKDKLIPDRRISSPWLIWGGIAVVFALIVVIALTTFSAYAGWIIAGAGFIGALVILWQSRHANLQIRLISLILVTTIPALVGISVYISSRAGSELESAANQDLEENNVEIVSKVSTWLELHARNLHELSILPDIVVMDASEQKPVLQAVAATHPNLFLVHTTNSDGINVARNDDGELQDYHDRGWYQGAMSGTPITYEVLISRTTGNPALNMATPIKNESGEIIGVASIVSELTEISKDIAYEHEEYSFTYIVDATNRVVAHPDPAYTAEGLFDLSSYPPVVALRQGESGLITFTDENGDVWRAHITALENGWGVITQEPEATLLSSVRQFQRVSITWIVVGVFLMVALSAFVIRRTLQPIGKLTETVSAIAAGDLSRVAEVKSQDEIGLLASTFNEMTAQLRELISNLEQRVSDRTKALAATTEVSHRISTILNRRELAIEVVEQVKAAFGYYHVHIYLFDDAREELIMVGGTGDAGAAMLANGHKVPKGRGLVGRAAERNELVLVTDTSQDSSWLPNPLLPETKSEAALPISIGDTVMGVLDVQQNVIGGLDQEDVASLSSIANQVAVALQNINQYQNIQKVAADLGVVANVGIATATITETKHLLQEVVDLSKHSFNLYHVHVYLLNEAGDTLVLASGAGEVGRKMVAQGHSIPLEAEQSLVARAARTREGVVVNDVTANPDFLPNPLLPKTRAEMAVPMIVAGKVTGVLDVQSEQVGRFTEVDVNIKTTLASQIAVALENARSFQMTQRQAERQTKLNQITQKIQGAATIEEAMQIAARELGHALGKRQTLVALDPAMLSGGSKAVVNE